MGTLKSFAFTLTIVLLALVMTDVEITMWLTGFEPLGRNAAAAELYGRTMLAACAIVVDLADRPNMTSAAPQTTTKAGECKRFTDSSRAGGCG
jgi:hypothetical protein